MTEPGRILYLIVCAAGPASQAIRLVEMAITRDWDVYVIPTPAATEFLDARILEDATGHPVRSRYRRPGEPGKLPHADAVILAPATYNTINKWAAGISDTFALGLLAEMTGMQVPTAVLPFVNAALAANRVYQRSIAHLREDGVHVIAEHDGNPPHPPGGGGQIITEFPWQLPLESIDKRFDPS